MKKVISIIICNTVKNAPSEPDGTELLYTDEERTFAEIVQNGIKQAKGKYTVFMEGDFSITDADALIKAVADCNADVLAFEGATAFKTSVIKNICPDGDYETAIINGILNCKTIEKSDLKPFIFESTSAHGTEYSQKVTNELLQILKDFKKFKAKTQKDVYSFAVDAICAKLNVFYMKAMLAVRNEIITAETLKNFDCALKENVVLYLAMDKRFVCGNLGKLRENSFKISFLTANKFKKYLNKQ